MRLSLLVVIQLLSFNILTSQNNRLSDESYIPLENCRTYSDLTKAVKQLNGSIEDNIEEVYNWIIDHIKYNHKIKPDDKYKKERSLEKIVENKIAICSEYVLLVNDLLNKMNITSEEVAGYCKNCESDDKGYSAPSHVWNTVLLDGEWKMMDVTWDAELSQAKKKKKIRSKKYFLKSSEEFLYDHLPAMAMWQLNDSLVSLLSFKNNIVPRVDSKYSTSWYNEIYDFMKLSPMQKVLYEDRKTYEFNPTLKNRNSYGQRILDYAGMLSDSLDESDRTKYNENRKKRREIIDLFRQAENLVIKMHTWQWELYASIVINEIVDVYNNDPKVDWTDKEWEGLNNEIIKARGILQKIEDTYYKDSSLEICRDIEEEIKKYID